MIIVKRTFLTESISGQRHTTEVYFILKTFYDKIYLITEYSVEVIVRTEITITLSKYESWDAGSDFTSAEILDSIHNDLDLGLRELLIKHLH